MGVFEEDRLGTSSREKLFTCVCTRMYDGAIDKLMLLY